MMNPDFISTSAGATVADALTRGRATDLAPQHVSIVCVLDGAGKLLGTVALSELVRAEPGSSIGELVEATIPSVALEADVPEVARLMSDYNLTAMPVVDPECRPVGIIAVDDVLELLVPEEWRRRAGAARD
jgi:Mg/Co/Ni transporter MgtE